MVIKIKHYYSQNKSSCGPACLRMVFEYFGQKISENKLYNLCSTKVNIGTSHKKLQEVIRSQDITCRENRNGNIGDLITNVNKDFLTIVNYINPLSGKGHYAVVIGYNKKKRFLIFADPSNGNNYKIDFNKFYKKWHNSKKTSFGWYLTIKK